DFVLHHQAGLDRIIRFLNGWAEELDTGADVLVVRYEDLKEAPEATLRRLLVFMGEAPSQRELTEAVEFASIENMRKLEAANVFWRSGQVLRPGRRDNPDSYKVRRAKVGGYRDYLDDDQAAEVDRVIRTGLSARFGYWPGSDGTVERGHETAAGGVRRAE